jgi:hypothetical protein
MTPTAKYEGLAGRQTLTITLRADDAREAKDFFFLVADSLKDKAIDLSGSDHEDAVVLAEIADAVTAALNAAVKRTPAVMSIPIGDGGDAEWYVIDQDTHETLAECGSREEAFAKYRELRQQEAGNSIPDIFDE